MSDESKIVSAMVSPERLQALLGPDSGDYISQASPFPFEAQLAIQNHQAFACKLNKKGNVEQ